MVKTRRPECNSCKTILYVFDFSLRSVGQSAPFRGKHDFAYLFSFRAETVNIFTYWGKAHPRFTLPPLQSAPPVHVAPTTKRTPGSRCPHYKAHPRFTLPPLQSAPPVHVAATTKRTPGSRCRRYKVHPRFTLPPPQSAPPVHVSATTVYYMVCSCYIHVYIYSVEQVLEH